MFGPVVWFQDLLLSISMVKVSWHVAACGESIMTFPNAFWSFLLLISAPLIFFEIATYSRSKSETSYMLSRPKIQPQTNLKTNRGTRVQKLQRILYWTPYFMAEDWQFGFGSKPFRKCPQPNCAGNHFYFYNHCDESWENWGTKRN